MRRMVRAKAPSVSATNETERRDSQMAGNTPKKNRTEQTVAEQKLVDGLHKHASLITSLMIGGAAMTTNDIVAHLQTRIDAAKAAQSTRATWQNAVKADKGERDKSKGFLDPAPIRGQSGYVVSFSYSRFLFSSMNFISNSIRLT